MLRRVFAAVVFTAAVGATASAQDVKLPEIDFGRYHALVIGNNEYQHVRNLTTAVGDADAVATLLEEKYGFQEFGEHPGHAFVKDGVIVAAGLLAVLPSR